eukprot:scaffold271337_cov31-Tisochrysis_lutea.AAC.2
MLCLPSSQVFLTAATSAAEGCATLPVVCPRRASNDSRSADAWKRSSASCISSPPASGGKDSVRIRIGVRYSRSRAETEAAEPMSVDSVKAPIESHRPGLSRRSYRSNTYESAAS